MTKEEQPISANPPITPTLHSPQGDTIDAEQPDVSIVPLKMREAARWHPTGAGDELEKAGFELLGVLVNDLPEPRGHLVILFLGLVLAQVLGVDLPVVHLDLWEPAHDELEFLEVEDNEESLGDDLVEANEEFLQLVFHPAITSINWLS